MFDKTAEGRGKRSRLDLDFAAVGLRVDLGHDDGHRARRTGCRDHRTSECRELVDRGEDLDVWAGMLHDPGTVGTPYQPRKLIFVGPLNDA